MEKDSLFEAWRRVPTEDRSSSELKEIIRKKGHSVLGKVRRQLIIESISAFVFLIAYYNFLDGDKKPFLANAFLVAAFLLLIGHNIITLLQMRQNIKGENIKQLLSDRLYKMKRYAFASCIVRAFLAGSFLAFFVSAMKLNPTIYVLMAGAILLFLIQLSIFIRTWNGRIARMRQVIESFEG